MTQFTRNRRLLGGQKSQSGLSLVEVMLLVFVLSGVVAAGLYSLTSQKVAAIAQGQDSALAQADRALVGFAAAHNRLPCPDTNGDGAEDCSDSAQKGGLPYRTLGVDGAGVSIGGNTLRYLVQRNLIDLTVSADTWGPIKFQDNTTLYAATHSFVPPNVGTPDLCARLASGAAAGALSAGTAVVASTPARAVGYALAHPGLKDEDGDGNSFDGGNAPADNGMESPERAVQAGGYDDRVVERSPASLAQTLNCGHLAASINLVSLAAETVDEVRSQKEVNTAVASVLTAVSIFKSIDAANDALTAITALTTAVGWAGTAGSFLAGAIAGCTVVVGCAELPHAIASVVAAAAAVTAATASVALSVVSVTYYVVAAAMTLSAAIMAGVSTNISFDVSAAITAAQALKTEATAKKTAAETAWQDAVNAQALALNQKNVAVANMYTVGRAIVTQANAAGSPTGTLSVNTLDAAVAEVTSKADAWMVAETNYANAENAHAKAVQATSGGATTSNPNLASATAAIQAQIDAETDPVKKQAMVTALQNMQNGAAASTSNAQQVQQITDQIASLDALIATNPPNVADLISQRALLQDQLANLTLDVASALAIKDAADQARTDAYAAYQVAVNAAIAGARLPYSVQACSSAGVPPTVSCTTTHHIFDGSASMQAALSQALHQQLPVYAADRGIYFQWVIANQKTIAARKDLDAAIAAEDRATNGYNSLVALNTTPTGTATTPSVVWNGAMAILQQADQKGGIR